MTVPARPDDITAEVFRQLTGHTAVTGVEVIDADHGTAVRARLEVTGPPGTPAQVLNKLTRTRSVERIFNVAMRLGRNEVEVYRRLGPDLGDVAPTVYGAASSGGRSVLLMEDLAQAGARFGDVVVIVVVIRRSVEHADRPRMGDPHILRRGVAGARYIGEGLDDGATLARIADGLLRRDHVFIVDRQCDPIAQAILARSR